MLLTPALVKGCENSGTSSIYKSARLNRAVPFGAEEKEQHRDPIFRNCVVALQDLVRVSHQLETFLSPANEALAIWLQEKVNPNTCTWTPEISHCLQSIWADPHLQEIFKLRETHFPWDVTNE